MYVFIWQEISVGFLSLIWTSYLFFTTYTFSYYGPIPLSLTFRMLVGAVNVLTLLLQPLYTDSGAPSGHLIVSVQTLGEMKMQCSATYVCFALKEIL